MLTLYRKPRYARRFRPYGNIRPYRSIDLYGGTRVPLDVQTDSDGYVITAPVLGMKVEDIKIEILDDVLTLSGETKSESEEDSDYLLREIHYGAFRRSIRLPSALNPEEAEAKVEDGLLTIRIPKAENARPKSIEVKKS
jgi:HSP20 family protein